MKYPTITAYCDAMRSIKSACATLRNVVVNLDEVGDPIYRASARSVRFNVIIDGVARSLRMFTGRVALSLNERSDLLHNELLVVTDDGESRYFDVIVEKPFEMRKVDPADAIELFENRARFCHNDRWGYTDSAGRVVIEPIYDFVDDFSESRAVVCIDGLYGLINTEGRQIVEPIYDELSYDRSHLCYTDLEGRWGVVDRTGRIITPNEWDWVGEYSQGMLAVELDSKFGFLDEQGAIAISLKYDDVTSFDDNGYAKVTLDGRSYLIDKEEFRV